MVASWLVPEHMAEERVRERACRWHFQESAFFFERESFKRERVLRARECSSI